MVTFERRPTSLGEAPCFFCPSHAALRVALLTRDSAALGRVGEDLAEAFYRAQGARILGRNVTYERLEVDLLAQMEGEVVVVEVRTRRANSLQDAAATLGPVKLERLYRAALRAVEKVGWQGPWRIDLCALDVTLEGATVHWYRNLEEEGFA